MDYGTKLCSFCGLEKPLEDFAQDANGKHGRRADCRDCAKGRKREWHRRNREQEAAYKREWRKRNVEKQRESYRAWCATNRAAARESSRFRRELQQQLSGEDQDYIAILRRDPWVVGQFESDRATSVRGAYPMIGGALPH